MGSEINVMQVRKAIQSAAADLAGVVASLDSTEGRVPRSERTVGDVAAHVGMGQRFFGQLIQGASSPFVEIHDFAPINEKRLADNKERRGPQLAGEILDGASSFLEISKDVPDDQPINFHFGTTLPMAVFACYVLYHVLVHGYEISLALGRPNPIDADRARLGIYFLKAAAPFVVDAKAAANVRECVEIRIRGGQRFTFKFDDGTLTVHDEPPALVACRLWADPVAFFLVGTGYVNQWRAISKGQMFAWGRKPWVALRLTRLIKGP